MGANPNMPITESIRLRTVGIDIGSSTTHVMFAALVLERDGRRLSSSYRVVHREVLSRSDIHLTPYCGQSDIDVEQLEVIIRKEYESAGIDPESIDTGAVIVTGEAAMKENAEPILELFAAEAGEFVCATAGPNLEAALAAHGSGAVAASTGASVLNVDIGGGTTKVALVVDGSVVDTTAMSIGARLVAWDVDGRLTRIEDTARLFMPRDLRIGDRLSDSERRDMVERMADCLVHELTTLMGPEVAPSAMTAAPYITKPLGNAPPPEVLQFSGGVSEFIYEQASGDTRDLGPELGNEIVQRCRSLGLPLAAPREGIRATIIGASQYTVQVSGNTNSVTRMDVLPVRNVPVCLVDISSDDGTFLDLSAAIEAGIEQAQPDGSQPLAFAFQWPDVYDYASLSRFCASLRDGAGALWEQAHRPLIMLFDRDVAGLVGALLLEEHRPPFPLVSLDQLEMGRFSYVDIGSFDEERNVVSVVVKSLVFR